MAGQSFGTLNEMFLAAVGERPKHQAFFYKTANKYRGISSEASLATVAALARRLDRLGVRQGDRLAILSENRLEWALTDYALLGLGAVVLPIYPTLLEPDVEFILADADARGIVVSTQDQLRKILNVRSKLPRLEFYMVMDRVPLGGDQVCSWHEAVESELGNTAEVAKWFCGRALDARPDEAATLLYTSGTTGQPKGVILTHRNLVSNIQACQGLVKLGGRDVAMSFLPLSHVFERMLDYLYFQLGVSIAYAERFETLPLNLLEVRPAVMAVVPRVLEKIHDRVMEAAGQLSPRRKRLFDWALRTGRSYFVQEIEGRSPRLGLRFRHWLADLLVLSKIRARLGGRMEVIISGAAAIARELTEFFYAVGLPIYEGYGLTETSPVISANYPGAVKLGTVGRVIGGVELKLDDASVHPDDEPGREILVRGVGVTPGYYRLDEENRQAFSGGWFRTGDLGRLDADGFLTITGRKKNLFKTSGGKFVSPEKLENLFQGHPYVSQVVVLGDGRRFVSALIVPHFTHLEAYAHSQGIAFKSREELVSRPEILAFIQEQVDHLTAWVPHHEKIRRIALLPHEFTVAGGELSPTHKVKRSIVEFKYRDLLESLYVKAELTPQVR
jgi:long-chain acyl-CoA synthetase